MLEFLRFRWNVVRQIKPKGWRALETIPNPGLNPFNNPYSIDYQPPQSRQVCVFADRNEDFLADQHE
jgi:hypothetical protein